MNFDPAALAAIFGALLMGGILKGATGAGVPMVAVPVMVIFIDLQVAVAVMAVVNLLSNMQQGWEYRGEHADKRLSVLYAGGCGVGALIGTFVLATAPPEALLVTLSLVVLVYVVFRLTNPEWVLERGIGRRLAATVGTVGGMLQGATGISAPITVTFLNALGLPRPEFIAVITVAFAAMSVPQVIALWGLGILDFERVLLGCVALAVVFAGMPVGAWVARRVGKRVFDRVILVVLTVVALKVLYGALA